MEILAVIPARGGSKGIPRKNVRLMAGKPLIYYAIYNAQKCELVTDVVVTSDDEEIRRIAEGYDVYVLERNSELARDAVTLDPVIFDAVCQMEQLKKKKYDVVITLQPTSPVLRMETLREALREFIDTGKETVISAVNKPHLTWSKNDDGFYPLYEERLNRQQLPPNYLETGAFLITKREFVTVESRMGNCVTLYEIPEEESVDIDSAYDWIVCEKILNRKKIVFRADGYRAIGMGHIYHCLTLAHNLIGHNVMFVTKEGCESGIKKIEESYLPLTIIKNDNVFFEFLKDYQPDIIVNDCLDTSLEYMQKLKTLCGRVVSIEDMGSGAAYADVVINSLYKEREYIYNQHIYSGENYICLRDEFIISNPKQFSPQVREVLVLFGGTDPSNLTARIYSMARRMHLKYPEIHFTFLVGIGYDCKQHEIFSREDENITIIRDTSFVSDYMKKADLAFTSQGRTVYEFAVMGVPAIVLAQNEREQLHTFAQMENGFMNLGLGSAVEIDTIDRTFEFLVNTPQMREEMRGLMLMHEQQLKSGVQREIKLIMGE